MFLKNLLLNNYKNFSEIKFNFDSKIICFTGMNGVGKTNIVDAIYHLSYTKSYFNSIQADNIKHDQEYMSISGVYEEDNKEEKIVLSLKRNEKKVLIKNGKKYKKFIDHIGLIPAVIISPVDRNLITDGSDIRRKFVDGIISQSNKDFLFNLIEYNRTLKQRNKALKLFFNDKKKLVSTLEIYNFKLSKLGLDIYKKRNNFLKEFIPIFKNRYFELSSNKEQVDIDYKSDLSSKEEFAKILINSLENDLRYKYTTRGIHKDDLLFLKDKNSVKKFASQGQQKSFLIALKLAQFDYLSKGNKKPILLLDDIFDKLDDIRVEQIIKLVNDDHFNQIFVTDTNKERSESIIKKVNKSYKIFQI
ncbi:MAG: DNA replication/repair protein RecF [Flavobacteriaceae bacterium]|tara:strand:- start:2076 stop:3155 length:1080 start_codon:yes stop_codon:yes gene_type:complete